MYSMVIVIIFLIGFSLTFSPLLVISNKDYSTIGKIFFFGMIVFTVFSNVYFYILIFDKEFLISLCYPMAMSVGIILAIQAHIILKRKLLEKIE